MNEDKLMHRLNQLAEQDIPGDTVNLWDAVSAQISANSAPRHRQLPRFAWAGAAIVVTLIAGFVLAPRLRSGNAYDKAAADFEQRQDYGVLSIYQQGLHTDLGLSHTFEGTTVKLDWAYADSVRVMIAYQSTGTSLERVIDKTTGVELIRAVNASGNDPYTDARIETFYVPGANMHATELHLTVIMGYRTLILPPAVTVTPIQISPDKPDMLYITDIPFDITVPMSPSRIFEVRQTVEAAGVPITLERLIVAPSASRADICFDPPSTEEFPNWRVGMEPSDRATLVTGQHSIDERYSMFSVVDPVGWISQTPGRTCTGMWFLNDLPLDGDRFTLTINMMDGITPDGMGDYSHIEGPWIWEITD